MVFSIQQVCTSISDLYLSTLYLLHTTPSVSDLSTLSTSYNPTRLLEMYKIVPSIIYNYLRARRAACALSCSS